MLKRFALLAAAALVSSVAHAAEAPVAPDPTKPFDHLPLSAANVGYPVAFELELTIPQKEDARAFWASFVASGIRPPEFGLSGVEEWGAMGPSAGACDAAFCDYPPGKGPRSVKWIFRSKPYRIDTPEQMAAEVQKLRTLALRGIANIHTKLSSGQGVSEPLPLPR